MSKLDGGGAWLASLLLISCSESAPLPSSPSGTGGQGEEGSIVNPGNPNLPQSVVRCGRSCTTDVEAARAALIANDYQKAFDLYQCADTPEAAFGAGLTRTLLALEGESADNLLADFGQPPLSATDLVGSDSILSRAMSRYSGSGDLSVTGSESLEIALDRVTYSLNADTPGTGLGELSASQVAGDSDASLYLSWWGSTTSSPLSAGERIAVSFTCETTYPTRVSDDRLDWIDLSFDVGQTSYWCSLPYSFPAGQCQPDGGSITIDEAPVSPGDGVSFTLQDMLLDCSVDDGTGSASIAPATSASSLLVRVSGTLSSTAVTEELDTSGLHPMFDDGLDLPADIPRDRTVTDLVKHAAGVALELEEAACFFRAAADGDGTIFEVPGSLYGAGDMPVSKGDTQILAALAMVTAAAGHVASAHDIDMPLFQLMCDTDPESSAYAADCPTPGALVSAFNAAFGATFDDGQMTQAKGLVAEALPLLVEGLGNLDESSLLPNNAASDPGLALMRDVVHALAQSVDGGPVPLPHVSPALPVDLGAFFDNPKSPQQVDVPFLLYEQTCDDIECYDEVNANQAFFEQYFAESLQADWDGDYTFSDDAAVEATFEEFGKNVARYLVVDQ